MAQGNVSSAELWQAVSLAFPVFCVFFCVFFMLALAGLVFTAMDSSDLWDAWQEVNQKYLTCSFQRSCSDADKGFRDCGGTFGKRTCVPAKALGLEGIPLAADEQNFEKMQSATHRGFPVPVMSS